MAEVSIIMMKYGESSMSEEFMFEGGSPDKIRPISFNFYLISIGEKRILVDTGCYDMPGWKWELVDFDGPEPSLLSVGIKPCDITDVIITHNHGDHTEAAYLYKNATFYIQEDEYELWKNRAPESASIVTFEDSFCVCDEVTAKRIGGHSVGSCIVEICSGDEKYVIAGDECYSRDNIISEVPSNNAYNAEKSINFFREYKDENLLICHEKIAELDEKGYVEIRI